MKKQKNKVLISTSSFGKFDPKPLEMLNNTGFEVTLNPFSRKVSIEELKELLLGKDAIIAGTENLNEEIFSTTPQLKYVCRLGVGMDNVDMISAQKYNIIIENTPMSHIDGVAELILAGILDLLRGLARADRNIRNGFWEKSMGSLLKGKNLGIIGLGNVGKRLVELTTGFGVKILAFDLDTDEIFANKYNIQYMELEDLLKKSEIISISIPYSREVHHLLSRAQFEVMRNDVMIVNTSRGGLLDEKSLFDFLHDNSNSCAYIDTFESEPYNGPLKKLDNVLMTPHIGTYAKEVRLKMEIEASQKLINYFQKRRYD